MLQERKRENGPGLKQKDEETTEETEAGKHCRPFVHTEAVHSL